MDIDPNLDISSFTHTHLYDHKFDVDDIIHALCSVGDPDFSGRFLLDTQFSKLLKDDGKYDNLADGDKDGYLFEIMPLPLESFKTELTSHMMLNRLTEQDKEVLLLKIAACQHIAELPALFEQEHTGGWLRERVKEKALEWLDARNLIPPSMDHVYDRDIYKTPPAKTQIQFTEEK